MNEVKIALAAGFAVLALAIGVELAHAPLSVAGKNGTPTQEEAIAIATQGATYCQGGESLPRGTSAIRPWLSTFTGPRVRVTVSAGGREITSGSAGSGWTGRVVSVPVKPLAQAVSDATVCMSFAMKDETLTVYGKATGAATAAKTAGKPLPGRIWIEYLRAGNSSWASLISTVATHMGFGHAAPGTWVVFLVLALLLGVAALASGLLIRELV